MPFRASIILESMITAPSSWEQDHDSSVQPKPPSAQPAVEPPQPLDRQITSQSLGRAFKQIRQSRHISLEEATGGQFSASMLSKFERGIHDLSSSKLLVALTNIHATSQELFYLARGFKDDDLASLQGEIYEAMTSYPLSYEQLRTLYRREKAAAEESQLKQSPSQLGRKTSTQEYAWHMVRALTIKANIRGVNESVQISNDEEHFLHDYLFRITFWGEYEMRLFSVCSTLLPVNLLIVYTREMLRKSDYFNDLPSYRNMLKITLLNCYLRCIDDRNFEAAGFFDKKIAAYPYTEDEAYLRAVYLWAQGYAAFAQGRRSEGETKMKKALAVFVSLNCSVSSAYYQNGMRKVLKNEDISDPRWIQTVTSLKNEYMANKQNI